MSALAQRFAEARSRFIPFIVAGDPDLRTSAEVLRALSAVDPIAIEVGVPFSDPTADGPVIQRAAQRAIERGAELPTILRMLRGVRGKITTPLVLFSYYNPILQFGLEKFAQTAAASGVGGLLVVDLPAEAAYGLRQQLRAKGIDLILLVAPTTSDARLKQIARLASGFLYAVSRTGVTGTARELTDESQHLIRRIRAVTNVPVAVGFGITTRAQAERVWRYADAAVVGSRIVAEIERAGRRRSAVVETVRRCAREFA